MKKILILLFFPVFANAQLDNIKIAGFGLQRRDLEPSISNLLAGSDETFEMYQRFTVSYKANPPATATTIVTADTVTAQALFELYRIYITAPTYVNKLNNDRVLNAVKAVVNAPLQAAITDLENGFTAVDQAKTIFGRRKLSGNKQ